MPNPDFDVATAERWFAVECNNRAWDLVESDQIGAEDLEDMLHFAHAAWVHWKAVGTPLNLQRAACLLATAYVKADRAGSAQRYAERCLQLSEENGDEQTPFDRATALGCAARAAAIAGDHATAHEHYQAMLRSVSAFDEPAEREMIGQLFPTPSESST